MAPNIHSALFGVRIILKVGECFKCSIEINAAILCVYGLHVLYHDMEAFSLGNRLLVCDLTCPVALRSC